MLETLQDFWARPIVGLNGFTLTVGVGIVIAIIVYVAFWRR